MSNLFLPKEIINCIVSFVEDLKGVEKIRSYFKKHISMPLKVNAIEDKLASYRIKYRTCRDSEYSEHYKDFYYNTEGEYEDKFIQMYYSELEDDLNILISCKCCLRHRTNRPVNIDAPFHSYKKRYDKIICTHVQGDFDDEYSSPEYDSDYDDEYNINIYTSCYEHKPYFIKKCDCPCRFVARNLVRIHKTTRKLYEEDIRTMLFYEAIKRVNYCRLADVEKYKEHREAFPEIEIEEEKNILFNDFFEKYLIKN